MGYCVAPALITFTFLIPTSYGAPTSPFVMAFTLMCFVVGWTFHLLERFASDIYCDPYSSALITNTAIFHYMSGMALCSQLYHVNTWERRLYPKVEPSSDPAHERVTAEEA